MTGHVIIVLAMIAQADGPSIDAAQFSRLIQGLHSQVRDISFLYEGGIRFVGPRHLLKGDPEAEATNYQGTYAYRTDGAVLLDVYSRANARKDSFKHNTYFMLGDKYEYVERQPDQARSQVMKHSRVVGALNQTGSPERILFYSYFNSLDPAAMGYQFLGWEEIDGHRCLKIQLNVARNRPGQTLQFWIDMERGGHPLRVDRLRGEKRSGRVEKIRLAQFPTQDGKQVWLPVYGENLSFMGGIGEYLDSPTFRETYSLVDGTIQINRGLKDEQFSLDWKGGMPETEGLKKLKDEFGPTPLYRNDVVSVQKRLDKKLAEADQQSARLDASAAGQSSLSTTVVVQLLIAVVGVVLIVGAVVLKRRQG